MVVKFIGKSEDPQQALQLFVKRYKYFGENHAEPGDALTITGRGEYMRRIEYSRELRCLSRCEDPIDFRSHRNRSDYDLFSEYEAKVVTKMSPIAGYFEGEYELPRQCAKTSMIGIQAQKENGIRSSNPTWANLIHPIGVSVISGIGDTIKVTNIRDGPREATANAFFRRAKAVPFMASTYSSLVSEQLSLWVSLLFINHTA